MNSMSSATPQIMSAVVPSCIRISAPSSGPEPGSTPGPEAERLRVGDLVGGHEDRAHRQEGVGTLGPKPLAIADHSPSASASGTPCQSRALHVVDDEVSGDVVERIDAQDPPSAGTDHDRELDLEVQGVAALRADDRFTVADDRVGELSRRAAAGWAPAARPRPRDRDS